MVSLERRLLYACRDCYRIDGSGPFVPPSAGNNPLPYVEDAVAFLNLAQRLRNRFTPDFNIDAAFVGTMADGILVAFRGTLSPGLPLDGETAADWLNNFDAIPSPGPAEFGGTVHHGFRGSAVALWQSIAPEIRRRLDAGTTRRIHITGHSKGGALAILAAWLCRQEFGDLPIRVITFAAARCGDQDFANEFQGADNIVCDRYEYGWDIVPYLPLGTTPPPVLAFLNFHPRFERFMRGYVSVGNLTYRRRAENVFAALGRRIFSIFRGERQGWPVVIQDHSIGPGSGYEALVASLEQDQG